jgi:hypothetical protein
MWYGIALTTWNSGGWLSALFAIFHLGIGLGMIWNILFTLLGKMRLRITRSEIVFASKILGLRFSSLTAARHNITKIELIRLSYQKDPQQEKVEVSSQINIWVGIKKISLGKKNSLTALEIDWLAHDLSNWLNLPIVKT